MSVGDFLTSKTVEVALIFAVLCGAAALINAPSGDRKLLNIVPGLPDALRPAPPELDLASAEAAPVVELDGDEEEELDPQQAEVESILTPEQQRNRRLLRAMRALVTELGDPPQRFERPCIEGTEDNCSRRAMDRYFDRLRDVALDDAEEPVRWTIFGDSLVLGDHLSAELRALMQPQFGDGGHGWVYIGNPLRRAGARTIRVRSSDAWAVRTMVRHSGQRSPYFGFAGAEFRNEGSATLRLSSNAEAGDRDLERFGLLFHDRRGDTSFRYRFDGQEHYETIEGSAGDGIHWVEIPRGRHSITFSNFSGGASWYGLAAELSGPGVVIDNAGQVSARVRDLLKIDPEHWAAQIRLRDTHLLSFFYGSNIPTQVASRFESDSAQYRAEYNEVLGRVRENNPQRDCLVFSMLTRGIRAPEGVRAWSSVPLIVETQRQAAIDNGCAFFDMHAFMGGSDGTVDWYRSRPQLLGSDLAHPTEAGYRELARGIYTALIYEFVEWLKDNT